MGLSNSVIPPVLPPARVMGAAERDAYKTARYAGNVGRSTMYVAPAEGTRYKVYPLCCPECRAHAEGELALLTRAQCCPRVAQLLGVWETREHPENNSKTDYPYLVLALEATTPIADPKVTALDWPLFRATVETAEELSKEAGREIDQSFATIQNSRRGPVLAHLDHPRAPKSMITKCLDPALFGTVAAEYTTWAQARVKK